MFNLQMAPPSWAKPAIMGERRLDSGGSNGFFEDDSEESTVMAGHLFWSLLAFGVVLLLHWAGLKLAARKKWAVPGAFQIPQVEIKVALSLCLGALDASFAVLAAPKAAVGWKLVAAAEVASVGCFVKWFFDQGRVFKANAEWVPLANVGRVVGLPAPVQAALGLEGKLNWGSTGKDLHTGFLTEGEVISMAKGEMGLAEDEARALFASLDSDGNGVLSYEEFSAGTWVGLDQG
jgi:hypothetical protein